MSAMAKGLVGIPSDWLSGRDPCSWYGIKCEAGRITSVNLHSKGISGSIPDSIAELSSLENLDIGKNQISGPIPSLAGLSALQTVNLEENAFTSIPNDLFSGLTSLQSLKLDNNPLARWSIPVDLGHCVSLQSFSAVNTSITGSIPEIFHQLPNLMELKLSDNNLINELPSSFVGSRIQSLYLDDQQPPGLSGQIDVVAGMTKLRWIWLQSNSFTGPIPDLSNLSYLTSFNVRNNQLTGPAPPSLTSCSTLKNVVLSNNMLQGPFPAFSRSVTIDVSMGNQFCNPEPGPCDPRVAMLLLVAKGFEYPLELAYSWRGNYPCGKQWTSAGGVNCDPLGKDITVLDFSGRNYAGIISPEISNLTSLTKIILSDNNLTGPIPDSLTKLPRLRLLDVTNNSLTGKIPDFSQLVSLKTSGNPMLMNNSSPALGDGGLDSSGRAPTSISTDNLSSGPSSSHAAAIWGTVTVIITLACCLACLIYYQRNKNCTRTFGQVETLSLQNEQETVAKILPSKVHLKATSYLYAPMVKPQSLLFSFQDLQKATDDFNNANILSRSGFSMVYKGNHKGTLIAVKRRASDSISNKGIEEFRAEINVLKKLRHRYLVALLGYCINANERLLVYEYMPNGTLGQHLFYSNENGYSALSWNQRLAIALDVARGIEYLHDLAEECFIHRNLNPSNILLDKDLRAKVSNFGLFKLVDSQKSIQNQFAGTFGYLAPEYAITGMISAKVDVYAFGVILMELITGRRGIDESLPDEESHLVKCFRRNMLDEKFMNYVDPTFDLDDEARSNMSNVAKLACQCTAREPNQRPDMGHVVNVLVPFVEKWNPSHCDDEVNYNNSSTTLAQKLRKWQIDDGSSTWYTDHGSSSMDSFHGHEGS